LHQRHAPLHAAQLKVYTVEVLLERRDGSRARDQKWVVAAMREEAEAGAMQSAARRWPNHTVVGVGSVRVDHSPRAQRFLRRAAQTPSHPGWPTAGEAHDPVAERREHVGSRR
jgi:hypothetical protein